MSRKLYQSEKKIACIKDHNHQEKVTLQKKIDQLLQEKAEALDCLRKAKEHLIDLEEELNKRGNLELTRLYQRNRVS